MLTRFDKGGTTCRGRPMLTTLDYVGTAKAPTSVAVYATTSLCVGVRTRVRVCVCVCVCVCARACSPSRWRLHSAGTGRHRTLVSSVADLKARLKPTARCCLFQTSASPAHETSPPPPTHHHHQKQQRSPPQTTKEPSETYTCTQPH